MHVIRKTYPMTKQSNLQQVHLPHSPEVECLVLGGMLSNTAHFNIGIDLLQAEDFFLPKHQTIFIAMQALAKQNSLVDIHLVAEQLKTQKKLEKAGGFAYLAELNAQAAGSILMREYTQTLKKKTILRKMIAEAQRTEAQAFEEPPDVLEVLDATQENFFRIGQGLQTGHLQTLEQILSGKASSKGSFVEQIEKAKDAFELHGHVPQPQGILSHFSKLDQLLLGLQPSNLMILAARPSMGKTALALNIAENICFLENQPVGMFSLEMSAEQLVRRVISFQSGIPAGRISQGAISDDEFHTILSAIARIQDKPFIIDDHSGLRITDLRARARRMKEIFNIQVLVIDYLQLLGGPLSYRAQESRQIEIAEISRMLKNLAKELDIPIICLAQLSRKVEERAGHRPIMSDLRESGSLEQDSDVVMFLFREEYYNVTEENKGKAELIIAKNRHGKTGSIDLYFDGELGGFRDLVTNIPEPPDSTPPSQAEDAWSALKA